MAVDVDMKAVDAVVSPSLATGEDLYIRLKNLQRELEFLEIQVPVGGAVLARRYRYACRHLVAGSVITHFLMVWL